MKAKPCSYPLNTIRHPQSCRQLLLRIGRLCLLIFALFCLLLPACSPKRDPVTVLKTAYDDLNMGDLDGFMKYVAEDAVFLDPNGVPYVGSEAIRDYLANEIIKANLRFELSNLKADGDKVTYTIKVLHGATVLEEYSDAVDIVTNGKIVLDATEKNRQSYCSTNQSKAYCQE